MTSLGLHRAKMVEGNSWIVGYYMFCNGKHYINNGCSLNEGWCEVKEETLGRYCGITDINNQMIFEGDILEYRHYDYFKNLTLVDSYILRYPPKRFGFVLQGIGCFLNPKSKDGYRLPREAHKMKIIGNIVDNPSLPSEIDSFGRVHEGKLD